MKIKYDHARGMCRVGYKNLWAYPTRRDAIIVMSYKMDVAFGVKMPNDDWSLIALDTALGVSQTMTHHMRIWQRLSQTELNKACEDVVNAWFNRRPGL